MPPTTKQEPIQGSEKGKPMSERSQKILRRLADDSNRTFSAVRKFRFNHRPRWTVKSILRRIGIRIAD